MSEAGHMICRSKVKFDFSWKWAMSGIRMKPSEPGDNRDVAVRGFAFSSEDEIGGGDGQVQQREMSNNGKGSKVPFESAEMAIGRLRMVAV